MGGRVVPTRALALILHEWEVQACFCEANEGETLYLSVRGTDSAADWVRNARALKVPWDLAAKTTVTLTYP